MSPPLLPQDIDLRDALHETLCGYRLSNMTETDDPSEHFPLIDLCSNAGTTIETGREELFLLADHLVSDPRVVAALSRAPGSSNAGDA